MVNENKKGRSGPQQELVRRLRLLEHDHAPDGWPAVQTRDITALLDDHEELTRRFIQALCERDRWQAEAKQRYRLRAELEDALGISDKDWENGDDCMVLALARIRALMETNARPQRTRATKRSKRR